MSFLSWGWRSNAPRRQRHAHNGPTTHSSEAGSRARPLDEDRCAACARTTHERRQTPPEQATGGHATHLDVQSLYRRQGLAAIALLNANVHVVLRSTDIRRCVVRIDVVKPAQRICGREQREGSAGGIRGAKNETRGKDRASRAGAGGERDPGRNGRAGERAKGPARAPEHRPRAPSGVETERWRAAGAGGLDGGGGPRKLRDRARGPSGAPRSAAARVRPRTALRKALVAATRGWGEASGPGNPDLPLRVAARRPSREGGPSRLAGDYTRRRTAAGGSPGAGRTGGARTNMARANSARD